MEVFWTPSNLPIRAPSLFPWGSQVHFHPSGLLFWQCSCQVRTFLCRGSGSLSEQGQDSQTAVYGLQLSLSSSLSLSLSLPLIDCPLPSFFPFPGGNRITAESFIYNHEKQVGQETTHSVSLWSPLHGFSISGALHSDFCVVCESVWVVHLPSVHYSWPLKEQWNTVFRGWKTECIQISPVWWLLLLLQSLLTEYMWTEQMKQTTWGHYLVLFIP